MAGIGAALATFLGALFGISQFTGGNPRPIPKWYQIHTWATLPDRQVKDQAGAKSPQASEQQTVNRLQVIAAYAYVLGLIGAVVFWALTSFSPYAADPIRNLSTSFLGVLVGILTVTLSVRQ